MRPAFTAIEIIAVLFLASLMATLTVVSLSSLRHGSELEEGVDHIEWCIELARHSAIRRHAPARLIFNIQEGTIAVQEDVRASEDEQTRILYRFPKGCVMSRCVVRGGDEAIERMSILISADGLSPSYAAQISGFGQKRWIFVAGLSGHMMKVSNEQDYNDLCEKLRARGMTLIEVVAGLAILASMLTAIFSVKSRVTRQTRITERRREATAVADALLASWWQNKNTFPRSESGPVEGGQNFIWRTQPIPNPSAQACGAEVVRLEVLDATSLPAPAPLVTVELILPPSAKNATGFYPH